MIIDSRAYAQAGLIRNTSDWYFGKIIGLSMTNVDFALRCKEFAKPFTLSLS